MESKYKIGDRVTVVHRMPSDGYYSHTLNGSTGVVDDSELLYDERYIYHLKFDDIVIAVPEKFDDLTAKEAWFNECCLDTAQYSASVELEDFESVLG